MASPPRIVRNLLERCLIVQDRNMWFLKALLVVIPLIATTARMNAEDGIAWEVQGNWRLNQAQTFLRKGDSVAPGVLLTADTSTNASILILLPDGQRLLFDCSNAHTCTQGFRVPALMAKPDDDAVELFDAIRKAMHQPATSIAAPRVAASTTETEVVAPLQTDGTVLLKQPLAALPPGQYRMTVDGESGQLLERSLKWSGPLDETHLPLPGAGVYRLRLFGSLGGERMRVVLLAASAELFSPQQKAFAEAKDDLKEWDENFQGWPIHEWLGLFLEGLAQAQTSK
jgi:hypothetical protein